MKEPPAASVVETEPKSSSTPAFRLVIRAEIIKEEAPQAQAPHRLNKRTLVLILASIAALPLIWFGIDALRTDPPSTRAVAEEAQNVEVPLPTPAPVRAEPPRKSPASNSEARSVQPPSIEGQVRDESNASPSPINQAIPNVPRSALRTIQGTVRVSVRVVVDPKGTVLAATADKAGPSRYFERLAIDAAKKWTFAPVDSEAHRMVLVRFSFTRDGTTASASPR